MNILKVKKSGILSRHKHTGPVHAFTLRGKWHYLEHDWWATAGSYSMEPPGETHTLEVPEGVDEMYTLFHVTGAYVYVDPHGKAEKIEDVFTKLEVSAGIDAELRSSGADTSARWREPTLKR